MYSTLLPQFRWLPSVGCLVGWWLLAIQPAFAQGFVKDIVPGIESSIPYNGLQIGKVTFFTAVDGSQLWKTDGTSEGTVLVKVLRGYGHNTNFIQVNSILYFTNDYQLDNSVGTTLWKSDGTTSGTVPIAESTSSIYYLTNVNSALYFVTSDSLHGQEMWKSDGTAAGTKLLKDIQPGPESAYPLQPIQVNGTLYFTADTGINGRELWKSDGTAEGTVLVKDIWPGTESAYPFQFNNVGGTIYFTADDGINGRELWKSDGTAEGTVLVKDVSPGATGTDMSRLTNLNGALHWVRTHVDGSQELWRSDGTADGTIRNTALPAYYTRIAYLMNFQGALFFAAGDPYDLSNLWRSDGTPEGTSLVRTYYSSIERMEQQGGILYLQAPDAKEKLQLYVTNDPDQTPANVVPPGKKFISILSGVDGTLYFKANPIEPGSGGFPSYYYQTNGKEVLPFFYKADNSIGDPYILFTLNNLLFYSNDDDAIGYELAASRLATFPTTDLGKGLLACYAFAGNAGDGAGSSHYGIVKGASLTLDRTNTPNSAYLFKGSDYITINANQLTNNNYSFSLWANVGALPTANTPGVLFSVGGKKGEQHLSFSNNPGGQVGWTGGGTNQDGSLTEVSTGSLPALNTWHHLTLIRTDTSTSLYVNGQLVKTSTNAALPLYAADALGRIGSNSILTQFFRGAIDDIRVYNRALSASEVATLYGDLAGNPCPAAPSCTATGYLMREVWANVPGNYIQDIPLSDPPTSTSLVPYFAGPYNAGDFYGARYRGFICPPQTGYYTFFIASDNDGELYLGTSDTPLSKQLIAYLHKMYAWSYQEYASQRSVPILLQAGKRYYIEALHKEGAGGDKLSVGWLTPAAPATGVPVVISGSVLSPVEMPSAPQLAVNNGQILAWSHDVWRYASGEYGIQRAVAENGHFSTIIQLPENEFSYEEGPDLTSFTYIDVPPSDSTYYYRVYFTNIYGTSPYSNVVKIPTTAATNFRKTALAAREGGLLLNTYPNPTNAQTTVEVTAREAGRLEILLYDLQGRPLVQLFQQEVETGATYQHRFDAAALKPGMYLLQAVNGKYTQQHKLVVIR